MRSNHAMKNLRLVVLMCVLSLAFVGDILAQPIKRPFPFTIGGRDTVTNNVVFPIKKEIAGTKGNVKVDANGHFVTANNERIRFFGTELEYSAQFLSAEGCKTLARHLQKLGINAVRLNYNDYSYDNSASLVQYSAENYSTKGSYVPNPDQFAKLDTLLYEFKQAGIYTFFVLQNNHYYYPSDGIAYQDSMWGAGRFVHFVDKRAADLNRGWAKTVLTHVNPLTNTRIADEPSVAGVEITDNENLNYAWRYNFLNYIDTNNYYNRGGVQSISFNFSRKLDTLYSKYLLKKYGSDAAINLGWKGGLVTNPPNLVVNGSFEKIGSPAWSFAANNGVTGDKTLLSPGKDSNYCMLLTLSNLGGNPAYGDAGLVNTTVRLGKDTLYELTFWAKVRYDAAQNIKNRSILLYLYDLTAYSVSINQAINIDTSWQQFKVPFRCLNGGLQNLFVAIGNQLGDVMLDGFTLKQKEEVGLTSGETSTISAIYRIPFAQRPAVPFNRYRDLGIFYDSLQRAYYASMISCIKDTIKAKTLVNCFTSAWWSTRLDAALNTASDYTSANINSDYPRARTGFGFTDSTQMISNTSPLKETGSYYTGMLASQSIEGKPHIASFMNPTLNQYYGATVPFIASYASLQDWDGMFFHLYALYRQNVFSDSIYASTGGYGTYYDIAGNPGILSLFPAVSAMFRNGLIKTSENYVPITHDKDDIFLFSSQTDYREPFGVEGYLDPNITTLYKVRQKFGVTKHTIASEYPYVSDTSMKVSETGELKWAQTSGMLTINADKVVGAIANFGNDTVDLKVLKFRRVDDTRDNLSLLVTSLDTESIAKSSHLLVTATTRAQNSNMIWWPDSTGIRSSWGKAPTVMSAANIELFIKSDSTLVRVRPLTSEGIRSKDFAYGKRITPESNIYKIVLDQEKDHAVWYEIEMTNIPDAVRRNAEIPNMTDVSIMPNPANEATKIIVNIHAPGLVTLTLSNVLGNVVRSIAVNERLAAGAYEYGLDVSTLPAGIYVLRAECGGKVLMRNVNVIK